MDDYMLFVDSHAITVLLLRNRVETLLHRLGLQFNPKKDWWKSIQVGDHLNFSIDLLKDEFRAPIETLYAPSKQNSALLGRATRNAGTPTTRSLCRKSTITLPRHCHIAVLLARSTLRPRGATWLGRPRPPEMTHQLK
jgi:hypothetical protein